MYRHEDCEQLKLELPFGVTLREDNRWVILSKLFPWEAIEQEYAKNFTGEEGQVALPSRLAFGALYIQTSEHYTDEQTRRNIQENPYLQYFCGFECYTMESPFDASMMTYFRKRISAEMVRELQALVFAAEAAERQDTMPEPLQEAGNPVADDQTLSTNATAENQGTLILDATCCPADIHNPTDAGLLHQARELVEQMVDILYNSIREQLPQKPRTYRQKARKEYLSYAKKRSHTIRETRAVIRGNLQYIRRDIGYIEKIVSMGGSADAAGRRTLSETVGDTGTLPPTMGHVPAKKSPDRRPNRQHRSTPHPPHRAGQSRVSCGVWSKSNGGPRGRLRVPDESGMEQFFGKQKSGGCGLGIPSYLWLLSRHNSGRPCLSQPGE